MIVKGNARGGGAQLAAHLMNAHDNERVELAETRGSIANDLAGAFSEWRADSKTTACEKYLYSLSINPDQAQGKMTREEYFAFIGRVEKRLGLEHQPRIVIFHEKKDKDGIVRQHCHVVWSRIDTKVGRAVHIAHDRMKLRTVAQEFARELGRALPAGMEQERGTERHEKRQRHADLKDKQQEERTGVAKAEHIAAITDAWSRTQDGPGFAAALKARGYVLARGDKRAYVVVDRAGELHSLARRITGAKAADVKARLERSHPLDSLPSIDEAKQLQARQRASVEAAHPAPPERTDDERRANLKAMQQKRRDQLAQQREALLARHAAERQKLALYQGRRHGANDNELHGIAGLVRRARTTLSERQQTRLLDRRQKAELKDHARQERGLAVLEGREHRSLEGYLRRNSFGRFASISKRFETLIDRMDAQLAGRTKSPDLRSTLRAIFAEKKPEPEKPASPVRSEFTDKAAAEQSQAENDAQRAAERMRQQQNRTKKLRPDQ
jgi:relaxase-like protein